jgi:hypothetical protein
MHRQLIGMVQQRRVYESDSSVQRFGGWSSYNESIFDIMQNANDKKINA